jgi:long-chain-alcohol oxidase
VRLSARQTRALTAICDTFAPGADGLPSASELGVPAAFAEILAGQPRAEQRRLERLLSVWDAPAPRRFSSRPQAAREAVLRGWCDSRLARRRAAFQALRKATLLTYAMVPGRHWNEFGYPGPLGAPADAAPRTIAPLRFERDAALDCDVCVVGSGAGGGTAAAVLATAGLDVVVLEAGGYYEDADFDGAELDGYRRLYFRGGAAATHDQGIGLLAGACVGGGTTINWTTSFRTPERVREEWAALGVPAFASEEYTRSLDAVSARLAVNREHNRPSARDEIMRRGLEALGWHVAAMPRNVQGCDQSRVCGYCGFGCQLGAKQSTTKTWLADACAAGARIVVDTRAERVLVASGRVRGVEARAATGQRVTVHARAVVAACGALETPALLVRSAVGNENVGRYLRLHPTTAVLAFFDEEIRPWEGTLQALYSDEHADLDGGYGVRYETGPGHPTLLAAFAPWRSASQHAQLLRELPRASGVGVLVRDRDAGEVRVGRDGEASVRYRLSGFDARHVRAGVAGAAQILEAAGARTVYSAHARGVSYEPGRRGSREAFLAGVDACGWAPGRCVLYSFHIMGSARMGGSRALAACDPEGELWDTRGLYVCDGSAFPTASGVNPMVSIEAIAHLNASRLAARLA